LVCPQCGGVLTRVGECDCGLDPVLIFAVVDAARQLSLRAARFAAEGRWQEAAIAASESLELRATSNDLAAFVLLASRLSGASGGPSEVTAPDPDQLPAGLQEHAARVCTAVRGLRALAQDPRNSDDGVRDHAAGVSKEWGDLRWLEAGDAGEPVADRRTRRPRTIAAVRAVVLACAFLAGGVFVGTRLSSVEAPVQAQHEARATVPSESPVGVEAQRDAELQALRRGADALRARSALQVAALASDWVAVASILAEEPPGEREQLVIEALPRVLSRPLYLAGLGASRKGSYQDAESLLAAAVATAAPDAYYRDDAIYYRGRALQRLGRADEAISEFAALVQTEPGSPYADDASRFRAALERAAR